MWKGSAAAFPLQLVRPCLLKTWTWVMKIMIWKVRSCQIVLIYVKICRNVLTLLSCLRLQVMWMMRWKTFFPSTCSLEQALLLDPHLCRPHAVVPVPLLLMENPLLPIDQVVDNNPFDHHKVMTSHSINKLVNYSHVPQIICTASSLHRLECKL